MAILPSDISFVLSGGTTNINANNSLGGDPSSTVIVNSILNNLFADVSPTDAEDGNIHYRCFYVFNDGTETAYNIRVWIFDEVEDGSSIQLGVEESDETQRITIGTTSLPSSGSVSFSYDSVPFVLEWDASLSVMATAAEDSLNSLVDGDDLPLLRTCTVTAQLSTSGGSAIFDILFEDEEGNRNQPTLEIVGLNLTPISTPVAVSTPRQGSPVNTIAPQIASDTTVPAGVVFSNPSEDSPITIFKLKPDEGFPIWLKRTTLEDTASIENDGVTIRFKIETSDPSV